MGKKISSRRKDAGPSRRRLLSGRLLQSDLPVALVGLEGVEHRSGYGFLGVADVAAPDLVYKCGGVLVDVVAHEDRGDQFLSQVRDRFGADTEDFAGVRVRLQLHAYHGGGIAWGEALRQAGVSDEDDAAGCPQANGVPRGCVGIYLHHLLPPHSRLRRNGPNWPDGTGWIRLILRRKARH